ncbi:hypothetical protein CoNPh26_CDS0027 [Staphylococcus phage S-CoN_Ph26]|nr:hypothetical protein CoNPh26_CDS0027 [Staphylococcus phage S-CoN_Ph26]
MKPKSSKISFVYLSPSTTLVHIAWKVYIKCHLIIFIIYLKHFYFFF